MTACQLLNQAASSIDEASRSEPVTQANRDLLRAIPVNAMPPRSLVADPESVPALCQAVITTAERARHAAWTAAGQGPQSTAISIACPGSGSRRPPWSPAITVRSCAPLSPTGRAANRRRSRCTLSLAQAAEHAGSARDAWLDATREYQEITTDIRDHMSPAAAEAAELAFWTGRLAYADPAWNLSSGPSHAARPAEMLAPELADVPEVVAAIHHASESVAQLATANLEQARSAVRGDRVLVPTRCPAGELRHPEPVHPGASQLPDVASHVLRGHERRCPPASRRSCGDRHRDQGAQPDACHRTRGRTAAAGVPAGQRAGRRWSGFWEDALRRTGSARV